MKSIKLDWAPKPAVYLVVVLAALSAALLIWWVL